MPHHMILVHDAVGAEQVAGGGPVGQGVGDVALACGLEGRADAADLGPLVTSKWPPERRKDIVIPTGLDAMTIGGKLHAVEAFIRILPIEKRDGGWK